MEYEFFTEEELACPCCGKAEMSPLFMDNLVEMRRRANFPFILSSAFRCEAYNEEIGGADKSRHLKGGAVDIAVSGRKAYRLLALADDYGMGGIGVSQKGEHKKRFIHLDGRTNPTVWSY